jgi:NADPH:quinone reductase-like Zn-dependent oxidoreductase
MDVAGTVVEVGADVTHIAVGDRVVVDPSLAGVDDRSKLAGMGDLYGDLGVIGGTVAGGYAERCLAPASHVYPVPDAMAIEHAATFPTCFLTASHALFPIGDLRAGETVLIHAAGSGVSVAAIQLAVAAGATVIATAGTQDKLDLAEQLGASHVLNNRTGDVVGWARQVTQGRGVDMVLDHVGTALFGPSLFTLARRVDWSRAATRAVTQRRSRASASCSTWASASAAPTRIRRRSSGRPGRRSALAASRR